MLTIIGREDLIGDPRWTRIEDTMYEHAPELVKILDEGFAKMTRDEALAKLKAEDVACEAVQGTEDMLTDPQILDNGYLRPWHNAKNGKDYQFPVLSPVAFQGDLSTPAYAPAPRLGEHSVEILKSVGYTDAEVQDMIQKGVTNVTDTELTVDID